jgi:hypothetical protein
VSGILATWASLGSLFACDKCGTMIEATPAMKEWRALGHKVICEKCWPPVEDRKE